jgi:carboxymethylenebutenolidase
LVVLQEIFGVNAHMRDVCDRYAREGWLAVAPALFDRADGPQEGLGYSNEDIATGRSLKSRVSDDSALLDVEAALTRCAAVGGIRIAVVGFCWGGTLSWLAASRLTGVAAAVAYYGTAIAAHMRELPRVAVLLHFGEEDAHIPAEHVGAIEVAHPAANVHRYPAGHGFMCDARASFHPPSAELAALRTAKFLQGQLE